MSMSRPTRRARAAELYGDIREPGPTPQQRQAALEDAVAAFLAGGGAITQVPDGVSGARDAARPRSRQQQLDYRKRLDALARGAATTDSFKPQETKA